MEKFYGNIVNVLFAKTFVVIALNTKPDADAYVDLFMTILFSDREVHTFADLYLSSKDMITGRLVGASQSANKMSINGSAISSRLHKRHCRVKRRAGYTFGNEYGKHHHFHAAEKYLLRGERRPET
ncbi:hypothetical protein ACJMK2_011917, partial [Sinanodonta woodiana]